jgi:hypothetical protein
MFVLVMVCLVLCLMLVFAEDIAPMQNTQEPAQRDSAVITRLPSWSSTGSIVYSRMWGAPMYVKKKVNTSQGFAGPCETYTEGNKTKYSCVTKALGRGDTFPIGTPPGIYAKDTAVGKINECIRGATKCVNNTYERCIGGFWISAEKCKNTEVCTTSGCRLSMSKSRTRVTISRPGGYIYNANAQISGGFV